MVKVYPSKTERGYPNCAHLHSLIAGNPTPTEIPLVFILIFKLHEPDEKKDHGLIDPRASRRARYRCRYRYRIRYRVRYRKMKSIANSTNKVIL